MQYTIKIKVAGKDAEFTRDAKKFKEMFELFLGVVENAVQKQHFIDEPVLTCDDVILATTVLDIIRIGTVISGFEIAVCNPVGGHCIMKHTLTTLVNIGNNFCITSCDAVKLQIVGEYAVYDVFVNTTLVENLHNYFVYWDDIRYKTVATVEKIQADYKLNPVLKEGIDMNWTVQYNVHTELKKAIELIETNPSESKKLLMVMDYMLSNKGE